MTETATETMPSGVTTEDEIARPAKEKKPRTPRGQAPPPSSHAVRVTHTDIDEWAAELIADAPLIEEAIVRITERTVPEAQGYLERHYELIAGYVARGVVVELVAVTDKFWDGNGEQQEAATAELTEWTETLRSTCEAGGLDVRGGRFGAL